MKPVDMYLVLYNFACMCGWGGGLVLAGQSLIATGGDLTKCWDAMAPSLQPAQWAMCLEVVHAMLGFVKSPVAVTFMQVSSRIVALCCVLFSSTMNTTWHAGLMAISWSLVEVPRYAFYLNTLLGPGGQKGTLYPVFWMRYSLFALLYPTGITGECFTYYGCAFNDPTFTALWGGAAAAFIKLTLAMYVPGGPFMYFNMVGNRRSAFKKRFAPPPEPPKAPVGVEFPMDDKGGRSTSVVGKKVFAAALKGSGTASGAAAGEKCATERNWRFGYNRHVMKLVKVGCESPAASLGSAKAGLAWMHENMLFHTADQKLTGPFGATVDKVKASFQTGVVKGTGSVPAGGYEVPYDGGWHPSRPHPPPESAKLSGEALKAQATKWAATGVIEPDAAEALCWTADYFASGKTLKDVYVVMIGAGSAMGPFSKLLEMGATVVAIDIPGSRGKGTKRAASGLWQRLTETAKASPGAIVFPLAKPQKDCATDLELFEAAGCDLMVQPGEIANWLCEWQKNLPASARVMIGNYTYLDSDLHVKLALCADYCISKLRKARPSTGVAFLCTPTDIHPRTDASDQAARKNYGHGLGSLGLEKLINALTGGKKLAPNFSAPVPSTTSSDPIKIVDGLSVAQGPNYALAKRMQHWRAQLEFEAGATVSSMVAPSTATLSVLSNRTFAWGYGGMPYFRFEIFKQATTNAVMAALLMHDALNAAGPKAPANRAKFKIGNTLELFRTQSVHGGLWRSPYKLDTIGECSALIYFLGVAAPYLAALGALGTAAKFMM